MDLDCVVCSQVVGKLMPGSTCLEPRKTKPVKTLAGSSLRVETSRTWAGWKKRTQFAGRGSVGKNEPSRDLRVWPASRPLPGKTNPVNSAGRPGRPRTSSGKNEASAILDPPGPVALIDQSPGRTVKGSPVEVVGKPGFSGGYWSVLIWWLESSDSPEGLNRQVAKFAERKKE